MAKIAAGRAERKSVTAAASVAAAKRKRPAQPDDPLAYILSVMRDPSADEKRRDAMAKEALPYCHAKLSGAAQRLKSLSEMTEAELAALEGDATAKG